MKNDKVTGAGIVCYYDNRKGHIKELSKDLLFLILKDFNGFYDLPKGTIDKGERSYSCAIRETFEESNLETFDFENISENPLNLNGSLDMFLGEIKHSSMLERKKRIKLKVNPLIDSAEHASYTFLNYELSKEKMYNYLLPYLHEAVRMLL